MAKKKLPADDLPLEQQPLFLKTLEFLPAERGELEQLARDMLALFNDAMTTASTRDIETSVLRYRAVVYRLHGDTFVGSGTEEGAGGQLLKLLAAPAGVVPGWGQAGEYLLEVEGMRLCVEVSPWGINGLHNLSFHAIDASAKFISETGYLSQFLHPDKHVGRSLGQAVRELVEQLLQGEFKPTAIRDDHRAKVSVPAWLVPVLQGVTRNGQLNMPLSSEALLPEPAEKVPLSNAERQRRHRQRMKELADTEGLKVIPLTRTDRMVLSLGVLAHEDLFHRQEDWVTSKKPGFDALLTKLWPEGDDGRYMGEPERSARRPAGFLHDELKQQRERVTRLEIENRALRAGAPVAGEVIVSADDSNSWTRTVQLTRDEDSLMLSAFSVLFTARADLDWLKSSYVLENLEKIFQGCPIWTEQFKAQLDQDQGIINSNKSRDKEAKRGWKHYEDERKQNVQLFKERDADRAEIKRLKEALQEIGQEVAGAPAAAPVARTLAGKPMDLEGLNREVDWLVLELNKATAKVDMIKKEQELLEDERNKAFEANRTLTERLRRAGLPTDYRKQPGE